MGEMAISVAYAIRQCKKENISLEDRLIQLATHGLCHLAGYDHETEEDLARMSARESAILQKVYAAFAADGTRLQCAAATATLLNKQNPIARWRSA